MSLEDHKANAPGAVSVYVATCSDTRDATDDATGAQIRAALTAAGHRVVGTCIWREDAETLAREVRTLLASPGFDVLIVNGGTGIAPRDRAYDVLSPLYDREIPGFGEFFRALCYLEIRSAAMLSRASAGVVGDRIVFSIPGSPAAVRLALEKLILPELAHCVGELRRGHVPEGRR
jgi:molybdenum cofactor biosynthesis protein B